MVFIGIDYGSKRVGVAVSDENATLAFPLAVIENSEKLLEKLKALAEEKAASTFVIGESKDYQGQDNDIMNDIKELTLSLKKEGFDVLSEPEFMTSIQASRIQGEGKMLDASAAAILLQSFLDKKNNKNRL